LPPRGPILYEFSRAHLALLVIDMQRDFIEPGEFGSALGNAVSRLATIASAISAEQRSR
jgi:biuret amidohydrolase